MEEVAEEFVEEEVVEEEEADDAALDFEPGEMEEVSEHLKEAVEGSFQMKRMLEREEKEENGSKKPKTEEDKVRQKLLVKWGLTEDLVVKHTLRNLALRELTTLDTTNYCPDK